MKFTHSRIALGAAASGFVLGVFAFIVAERGFASEVTAAYLQAILGALAIAGTLWVAERQRRHDLDLRSKEAERHKCDRRNSEIRALGRICASAKANIGSILRCVKAGKVSHANIFGPQIDVDIQSLQALDFVESPLRQTFSVTYGLRLGLNLARQGFQLALDGENTEAEAFLTVAVKTVDEAMEKLKPLTREAGANE
jgi:hypothetical protein